MDFTKQITVIYKTENLEEEKKTALEEIARLQARIKEIDALLAESKEWQHQN